MGFLDELRKLTQPYDDDNDFFDGSDFNEPSQTNLRASSQQELSATQKYFESTFGGGDGGRIEPEAAPKEETAPAQPPAGESGAAGGGLFSGFGFKKAAKPRRERLVNVGGRDQQVILFNPKSFDEAGELVTHLEQNRSVVMTLEGVQNDFAAACWTFCPASPTRCTARSPRSPRRLISSRRRTWTFWAPRPSRPRARARAFDRKQRNL